MNKKALILVFTACLTTLFCEDAKIYEIGGGVPSPLAVALTFYEFSSPADASSNTAVQVLEKRDSYLRAGNKEKVFELYMKGESLETAKADFADWSATVNLANTNSCYYKSVIRIDNIDFVSFLIGKSEKDAFPVFEAVQKTSDGLKINKEIGMDSFGPLAGSLIDVKKAKPLVNNSHEGICIQVQYKGLPEERRLNPGEKLNNNSAYLWLKAEALPIPIPFAKSTISETLDPLVVKKCRQILSHVEAVKGKNEFRLPMYDKLRIDADHYSIISQVRLSEGSLIIIKADNSGRSMVIYCNDIPLNQIDSIQEMLNFESIPDIISDALTVPVKRVP
jgi:hypothetical protein